MFLKRKLHQMEVHKSAAFLTCSLLFSFHHFYSVQLVKKKVPLKCMDEVNENSSQNRFVSTSPAQLRLEPLYVARAAFETAFLAVH